MLAAMYKVPASELVVRAGRVSDLGRLIENRFSARNDTIVPRGQCGPDNNAVKRSCISANLAG